MSDSDPDLGHEGDAVKHMMRNLEIERVGLAAMSLGIGRRSIEVMVNYGNERKAFGKSLSNFGQIQAHIGTSYAEVFGLFIFSFLFLINDFVVHGS